MGKAKRVPQSATQTSGGKVAAGSATPSAFRKVAFEAPDKNGWYTSKPVWSLSKLELDGPFGWQTISGDKLKEVLGKLRDFEQRTWNEILSGSAKQNHHIDVGALCKEARDRLEEMKLDDIDQVLSIRLSGKERVFSIHYQHVAFLMWWDPDHAVCPAPLKNT